MSAWFESLTGLAFVDPGLLLLALLVPIGLLVRAWRGVPALLFAPGEFIRGGAAGGLARGRGAVSWRRRLVHLPRLLQVLGIVCLVLALARPVQRTELPLEAAGIDILLGLDVSSSMAEADMGGGGGTRLDVARAAAQAFAEGRPDDRIGLLPFARYPDLRCPLTLDHAALAQFLREVELVEREGPEDATGIGTAVARAGQVLGESAARSRVLVLLTDGEENVATDQTPQEIAPLHAAQLCADLGVRVYVIAVGTVDGAPGRPGVGSGTGQVRRLARRTGGRYFEARDASAVNRVYAEIDALEKQRFAAPRFEVIERFLLFLAGGVILILAARLLESTVLEVLP